MDMHTGHGMCTTACRDNKQAHRSAQALLQQHILNPEPRKNPNPPKACALKPLKT